MYASNMDIQKELERISKLSIDIYKVANSLLEHEQKDESHFTPITKIGLPPYAENRLVRQDILYVEQVAKMSRKDLSRLRGMGDVTLQVVIDKVREFGLDNNTW